MAAMKYSCLIVLFMMVRTVVCQESIRVNPDHLNKRLLGHVVFDMKVEGLIPCVQTCKFLGACESINFIKRNQLCEINDISSDLASPGELATEPGTIFGDMTEYPSVMAGSCANHKCGYRQRCYPAGRSHDCVDIVSDCLDLLKKFGKKDSGVYSVTTWTGQRKVYCDMTTDEGGWTVFQYRFNGVVDFYRNFSEYETGFGNVKTEFWLGLRHIKEIASQGQTDLRIDLEAANGTKAFEVFDKFYLSPSPNYTLNLGQTTDSLRISSRYGFRAVHNGKPFSTYDRDVDTSDKTNCAEKCHGAWWYRNCHYVNLNGLYMDPGTVDSSAMVYSSFLRRTALKSSKMMMRRKTRENM